MNITIYHNPRCSKSKRTLEIIREHGIEPRIVEYLDNPPDPATILRLSRLLQGGIAAVVRQGEAEYREAAQELSGLDDEALAAWLSRHPRAIERPIVVDEDRRAAVIGRPPDAVLGLLSEPPAESSAES